jgi:hypothetical protein
LALCLSIGFQNSYDRLQVILARTIEPAREATGMNACGEAVVRTPAWISTVEQFLIRGFNRIQSFRRRVASV